MTTIDESGAPQTWTAVYWRYHGRNTEECESLGEALGFLYYGLEDGRLALETVLNPGGRPVFADGDQLLDAVYEYGEGRFTEWAAKIGRPELTA